MNIAAWQNDGQCWCHGCSSIFDGPERYVIYTNGVGQISCRDCAWSGNIQTDLWFSVRTREFNGTLFSQELADLFSRLINWDINLIRPVKI